MRLFYLLAVLGASLIAAAATSLAGVSAVPKAWSAWVAVPSAWAGSAGIGLAIAYLVAAGEREPGRFFLGEARLGRIVWRFILVPYLGAAIPLVIVSRLVSRERLFDRVADRLYVGGAPLFWNQAAVLAGGIDTVLNLCVEFGDFSGLATTGRVAYRREGWLDGTAPTLGQYQQAVEWIVEQHRSGRTILVHCAQGHGRSALAAAGAMLALGLVPSPDEAARVLRAGRPTIRLHGEQRRLLDRWWSARS